MAVYEVESNALAFGAIMKSVMQAKNLVFHFFHIKAQAVI